MTHQLGVMLINVNMLRLRLRLILKRSKLAAQIVHCYTYAARVVQNVPVTDSESVTQTAWHKIKRCTTITAWQAKAF